MLQAIVKKGRVIAESVPSPKVSKGSLLIKVINSCISAGTEITGVKESGMSLIKRALNQPKQLQKVINLAGQEGIIKTLKKVKGVIDSGKPTGYSISGIVIGIGQEVSGYKTGDYVAAAGASLANHAEYVDVPVNLVVKFQRNNSCFVKHLLQDNSSSSGQDCQFVQNIIVNRTTFNKSQHLPLSR